MRPPYNGKHKPLPASKDIPHERRRSVIAS